MAKKIIIWFGQEWSLRKNETVKDIKEEVEQGGIQFDAPDFLKITDIRGNTLLRKTNY